MDLARRSTEYIGLSETNGTEQAALSDILPMGSLTPDGKVAEVMRTEGEMLCYRY